MALAYISFAGINNGQAEFYADIGTNKFYRYKIGGAKSSINGLNVIDEISFNSAIFEQAEYNPFNSRFMIRMPAGLFKKSKAYVQLHSYASKDGTSPAISELAEVYPQADTLNNEWPLLTMQSKKTGMQNGNNNYTDTAFNPCRSVSFSFTESKFSNAMFLDSLLKVAKDLAPGAIDALFSVLKSGSGAPTGTPATPPNTGGVTPSSDNIMKLLTAIIDAVGKQSGTPAQTPAPAPVVTNPPLTKSLGYSNGLSYRKIKNQRFSKGQQKLSKQQFVDGGVLTGPLLASLLGPIIQAAPQLLQAIGDTPVKWLNAKNEGDLKKLVERDANIQKLLAMHNQNVLLQLLANTGQLGAQNPPLTLSFSTNNNITVSFEAGTLITVSGKQKSVYKANAPVKLLLHIGTSGKPPERPIPKAIVQMIIKDPVTQKVLLEKKYRMTDVHLNSMLELEILPEESKHLPLNTDLLVCASFSWPSKSAGKRTGNSNVHAIFLVHEYLLKHFGDKTGEDTPLTDMNKYRVFWNKIWEGSSGEKRRWEATLDVKYYTCYKPMADSNARIETKMKLTPKEDVETEYRRVTEGKLKSGIEISPVELNKLIPEISSHKSLSPSQLRAFQSDDLQKRFNQEAKAGLEIKGLKNQAGAVWVYPEVAMHKVTLSKVVNADAKGQVTELADEEVYFPGMSAIHFAGVKTE